MIRSPFTTTRAGAPVAGSRGVTSIGVTSARATRSKNVCSSDGYAFAQPGSALHPFASVLITRSKLAACSAAPRDCGGNVESRTTLLTCSGSSRIASTARRVPYDTP